MSDKFYIPSFVEKTFSRNIRLGNESIQSILEQLESNIFPDCKKPVYSKNTMTSKVSRASAVGSLDHYFPKLCKQESENETSESEFEMVHRKKDNSVTGPGGKVNQQKKCFVKNKIPTCESTDRNRKSFGTANDANKSLFHSTALGNMHENEPMLAEESGIHRPDCETSDDSEAEDDPRFNGNVKGEQSEEGLKTQSKCKKEKNKKSSPRKHGTDNICSQDMFSEDKIKNNTHLKKDMPAHSLSDDEIIPSSQDYRASLRLSLSSANKIPSNSKVDGPHSGSDCNSKSASGGEYDSSNSENSHSDIAASQPNKSLADNKDPSLLDELTNKMKEVNKVEKEKKGNQLCLEDITEDDELILIQCPKEVDPQSLKGKKIGFKGESSMSLKRNEEEVMYDSFFVKENSNRMVNLLLPKKGDSEMTLGVVPIVGNIVLSESVDVPELKKPEIPPPKKVEFPGTLEEVCLSLPVSDTDYSTDHNISLQESGVFNSSIEKKKKKKSKQSFADSTIFETSLTSSVSEDNRKKKRKRESNEVSGEISDLSSQIDDTLPRKKKKKSKELPVSTETEDFKFALPPGPDEIPRKKKKKTDGETSEYASETFSDTGASELEIYKKKKKKDKGETSEYASETFTDTGISDLDTSKKKKKKSKGSDAFSPPQLEQDIDIKMEVDQTNEFPLDVHSEDVSPKKKKKKHKSKENETDLSTELQSSIDIDGSFTSEAFQSLDVTLKKKKKKHKQKGNEMDISTESQSSRYIKSDIDDSFSSGAVKSSVDIDEPFLEQQHSEITLSGKHKKKHKKRSKEYS